MMTNCFTLFSHSMLLILLFIVVIFCSCEDNGSVVNQVCCVDECIDESKISQIMLYVQTNINQFVVVMESHMAPIATPKMQV